MKSGSHSISEIGRVLYISKPYMTMLIDSLMENGWIERRNDPDDRRVIHYFHYTGRKKTPAARHSKSIKPM